MSRLCLEWRNQVSGRVDAMDSFFWRLFVVHFEELRSVRASQLSFEKSIIPGDFWGQNFTEKKFLVNGS